MQILHAIWPLLVGLIFSAAKCPLSKTAGERSECRQERHQSIAGLLFDFPHRNRQCQEREYNQQRESEYHPKRIAIRLAHFDESYQRKTAGNLLGDPAVFVLRRQRIETTELSLFYHGQKRASW